MRTLPYYYVIAKLFLSWLRSSEGSRCNSKFHNEVRLKFPKFELNFRSSNRISEL